MSPDLHRIIAEWQRMVDRAWTRCRFACPEPCSKCLLLPNDLYEQAWKTGEARE